MPHPDTEAALNRAFPMRGPCGICGHGWARHRECDAVRSLVMKAGESVETAARWYDYDVEAVHILVSLSPSAYGWWLRSEGKRRGGDVR